MTSYAKFRKIRRHKDWPGIWLNVHLAYFLYFYRDFLCAYTEKNTQQFQAFNGLKRSTVGNLGSLWGIRYNVIRIYPLFGVQLALDGH